MNVNRKLFRVFKKRLAGFALSSGHIKKNCIKRHKQDINHAKGDDSLMVCMSANKLSTLKTCWIDFHWGFIDSSNLVPWIATRFAVNDSVVLLNFDDKS